MATIEMQDPIVKPHSKMQKVGLSILLVLGIIIGSLALEYRHEQQQDAEARAAIVAFANVFNSSW